jgi:hypothetical protein
MNITSDAQETVFLNLVSATVNYIFTLSTVIVVQITEAGAVFFFPSAE